MLLFPRISIQPKQLEWNWSTMTSQRIKLASARKSTAQISPQKPLSVRLGYQPMAHFAALSPRSGPFNVGLRFSQVATHPAVSQPRIWLGGRKWPVEEAEKCRKTHNFRKASTWKLETWHWKPFLSYFILFDRVCRLIRASAPAPAAAAERSHQQPSTGPCRPPAGGGQRKGDEAFEQTHPSGLLSPVGLPVVPGWGEFSRIPWIWLVDFGRSSESSRQETWSPANWAAICQWIHLIRYAFFGAAGHMGRAASGDHFFGAPLFGWPTTRLKLFGKITKRKWLDKLYQWYITSA